jgi:hypothetical protein
VATYPKCGTVTIQHYIDDEYEGGRDYKLTAIMNGKFVGAMDLTTTELDDGEPIMAVEYAKVIAHRRCGIGTKLYEKALALACENRLPLASDSQRTEASEGFWSKQAKKGRAVCYLSDVPAGRLHHSPTGFTTVGKWPCYRYVMREACPRKMDLSGRRRR